VHIKRLTFPLAIFCVGVLAGCDLGAKGPRASVSNITHQEHPEFVNGEMDWGSEVALDVRNEAERGMIHVNVSLSSSEGQWSRSQDLLFEAGESKHLTYFFQEPTINAMNKKFAPIGSHRAGDRR